MPVLNQKIALITGASRGIGQAIAQAYLREGAKLALVATRQQPLQQMCEQWGVSPEQALCIGADVSDADQAQQAVTQTLKRWGRIDVLVNNAGNTPRGTLFEVDEATWRQGWELKIFGYINLTRAVYRQMFQRRRIARRAGEPRTKPIAELLEELMRHTRRLGRRQGKRQTRGEQAASAKLTE